METVLERRVTDLEDLLEEVFKAQAETQHQLSLLSREVRDFKREISSFKDETRTSREYSDTQLAKSRENSEREWREFRKLMAELSHKMGTMAEDLVAPSVPRLLQEIVKCTDEPTMEGIRIRKRLPNGRSQEYDVIATCGDYLLINETKSRLRPDDIPAFVERLQEARTFLPEYADKQIIGTLASLYIDPSLVVYAERQGIVLLGVVDGLMKILNSTEFHPKLY